MLGKTFSKWHIEICLLFFFKKTGYDTMQIVSISWLICFLRKNMKNINVSFAELVQSGKG